MSSKFMLRQKQTWGLQERIDQGIKTAGILILNKCCSTELETGT